MHFPRYWQRASEKSSNGEELFAWGWSDESEGHARDEARRNARRIATFITNGKQSDKQYGYGERALREPVLEEIKGGSDLQGLISRNSYGAKVLNTTRLLMADVDFRSPGEGGGLFGGIKKLFGGSGRHPEEEATLKLVEQWTQRNRAWSVRVYRTFGGARLLVTHEPIAPKDKVVNEFFEAVGADPQYRRLCAAQESFRARLTPKPWRVGMAVPPTRWPFLSNDQERSFNDWLKRYELACKDKAACRYVSTVGSERIERELEELLKVHDQECLREGSSLA